MIQGADTVIIGGGVVGAAVAYYLARAGVKALLLERRALAAEASGANAGMIGMGGHAAPGALSLMRMGLDELSRLETELDHGFELRREGRLFLAHTEEDLKDLELTRSNLQQRDIPVEFVDHTTLCRMEPLLDPHTVVAAIYTPADGQLNPFLLTHAYAATAIRLGARVQTGVEVTGLLTSDSRVMGVRSNRGDIRADRVILAAGAWSACLADEVGLELPVRPGRGQMMATERLPRLFPRVLRGPSLGMRQTVSGNVLIGSTVEWAGYDKSVTRNVLSRFAAHWQRVIPLFAKVSIVRTWAGLRPMSDDNLPFIGRAPGVDGLWLATGHGRTGLTWSAVTGMALAQLITTGRTDLDLKTVDPGRLSTRAVGA